MFYIKYFTLWVLINVCNNNTEQKKSWYIILIMNRIVKNDNTEVFIPLFSFLLKFIETINIIV